jgi:flagellar hook-length control protein FliK
MSDLSLLSVIAPAVPAALQGSSGSGEVTSGFGQMLATFSGEPGTSTDVKVDAGLDGAGAAGFLQAPMAPPVPLVLPAAEDGASKSQVMPDGWGEGSGDAAAGDPPGTQATTPLPVEKALTGKTAGPEVQPREQTTTPLLSNKPAATKPPRPEVQPPQREAPVLTVETSDTELTVAEAPPATTVVDARARTGNTPVPLTLPPVTPPPPLRPSAERNPRLLGPLETVAGVADGSGSKDPARTVPTTLPPAPAANIKPATGPAEFTVAAVPGDIAGGGEADGTGSEPLPSLESTAASVHNTPGMRETGLSQLSRATVEATAQIAAQILRRLEGRSTRFEMALTPDELGRVDVKLDIDSEGRLNARLAFDNPAAATDLKGRADELRRQLEDAGFQLADDAFEFTGRDSGSSAFDRGQDDRRNGSSRAFAAASRLNSEIDVDQPPRWLALSLSPSGVDMKV